MNQLKWRSKKIKIKMMRMTRNLKTNQNLRKKKNNLMFKINNNIMYHNLLEKTQLKKMNMIWEVNEMLRYNNYMIKQKN